MDRERSTGVFRRMRLMLALVALSGLLLVALPAKATHVAFHRYSIAQETNHPPYRGVHVYRYDATVDCGGKSDAVYTPAWATSGHSWIEVGTAYCKGNTFWYWGYGGLNSDWTPWFRWESKQSNGRLGPDSPGPGPYSFQVQVEYYNGYCWGRAIISYRIDSTFAALCGYDRAEAGLESYNDQLVTVLDHSSLQHTHLYNGANFHHWTGYDAHQVNAPLYGLWRSSNQWRSSQGVAL